jgi:CheY-like chemotaxis protein
LIVDDEPRNGRLVRDVLHQFGIESIAATTVEEADRIAAETPLSGALVDYMMPGEDGVQFCIRLRQQHPLIPITVMSGYIAELGPAYDDVFKEHRLLFLSKPFTVVQLLHHVGSLITSERHRIMIFESYSHRDAKVVRALDTHFAGIARDLPVVFWQDTEIVAGEEIDLAVRNNLERADIVLLLISADYIASEYCYRKEMKQALARHSDGLARVIPVILRPVQWADSPFRRLLALPKDGKPITAWSDRERACLDVAIGVRKAIDDAIIRRIQLKPYGMPSEGDG